MQNLEHRRKQLCGLLLFWCFLGCSLPAFSADGWKTTLGAHYSSGEYGKAESTEIYSAPVSLRYRKGNWDYKVSVPWVSIDGPGNVDSAVVSEGSTSTSNGSTEVASVAEESGVGDTWVSFKYRSPKKRFGWWWDSTVKVKIPTADEEKGLGTGEEDFKFVLSGLRAAAKGYVLWDFGYKVRGSSDELDLDDSAQISVGYFHRLKSKTSVGVNIDYVQASHNSRDDAQELMLFYSKPLSPKMKLSTYGVTGIGGDALDYGLGVSLSVKF